MSWHSILPWDERGEMWCARVKDEGEVVRNEVGKVSEVGGRRVERLKEEG